LKISELIAMHRRNKLFVTIGLAYGLLGGLLMLVRLVDPGLIPGNLPRIHGHMMLLGFVLMTVYGVGLHVIPRFGGYPLRSERVANVQFWLANAGLPLMILGWFFYADWLVTAGGLLTVAAMALFGINMILTVRFRSPLDAK
jgi:cbb3-type cytochrome oxidase subunit 1